MLKARRTKGRGASPPVSRPAEMPRLEGLARISAMIRRAQISAGLLRLSTFRNRLYVNEEASYREASFVDCSAEFTKTTPAVSIVIVSHNNLPETVGATDDLAEPLAAICRAVKQRIRQRPRLPAAPPQPLRRRLRPSSPR